MSAARAERRRTVSAVERFHAIYDEAVAVVADVARLQGTRVACDTCSDPACCRDLIHALPAEVVAIVDWWRRQGREVELRQRVARGRAESWRIPVGASRSEQSLTYRATRPPPCAFLTDAGRCSMYEVRPFNCRGFTAIGDPAECGRWQRGIVSAVTTLDDVTICGAALAGGAVIPGSPDDAGPMFALLGRLLANPEAHAGA